MEWTPAYVAFLYYVFVVITYFLPFADVAIVIASLMLSVQPNMWRGGRVVSLVTIWLAWAWLGYSVTSYRDEVFEQAWAFTKVWLVVLVAFNVLRSRAQIRFFMAFGVVCFLFFPTRGAFVNYFSGYRLFGRALWNYAFENPNDLAANAILFCSLALALYALCRNRLTRVLSIGAFASFVALVFFTQSRGAIVAMGIIAAIWAVGKIRKPRVILSAAAVVIIAALIAPSGTWSRIAGLKNASLASGMKGVDSEGSAEQRLQLMRMAANISMENPLLGVGIGAHGKASQEFFQRHRTEYPLAGGARDSHSTYLHIASELGLPGLAILLTLCVSLLLRAFRTAGRLVGDSAEAIRYMSFGLLAFLVASIFGSFEYVNTFHLYLVLLEAGVVAFAFHLPPRNASGRPRIARI